MFYQTLYSLPTHRSRVKPMSLLVTSGIFSQWFLLIFHNKWKWCEVSGSQHLLRPIFRFIDWLGTVCHPASTASARWHAPETCPCYGNGIGCLWLLLKPKQQVTCDMRFGEAHFPDHFNKVTILKWCGVHARCWTCQVAEVNQTSA